MKTLVVALCLVVSAFALREPHPLSDAVINHINDLQLGWSAGKNFNPQTSVEYLRTICGVKVDPSGYRLPKRDASELPSTPVPHHYDAREAYPNCPSIAQVRDQGNCGSCWAFGAVEAMTDRFCIHSNNSFQFEVSAEDPLSCCSECGNCEGGYPDQAWRYWVEDGIVSGGGYHSNEGCYPYEIRPCGVPPHHPFPSYCRQLAPTPPCVEKCEKTYDKTFRRDLHFGVNAYAVDQDVQEIQQEVFKNGPVEATMAVYWDFFNYKDGVYRHHYGGLAGYHAIRILGWGTENGQDYWLVANSWGKYWGLQGFFKILRGVNECGIEAGILAGLPKEA